MRFRFRVIVVHLKVNVLLQIKLIMISANKDKYVLIQGQESRIYPEFPAIPLLCKQPVRDLFFQPSTHFYRKRIVKS